MRISRRAVLGTALFASAAALAPTGSAAAEGDAGPRPRLVLLLVVDQLSRDRLDPALPGGLGRIAREGRVFAEGVLAHAGSETCPGHVAIATGRHPGPAGIPANQFVDLATGEKHYCVDDSAAEARVFGATHGRSPRLIRVDALGDWLKATHEAARAFAVAGKDRSAIALGGQHPDGAYWLEVGEPPFFTTSAWYQASLPEWLARWNGTSPPGDGFLSRLPEEWQPALELRAPGDREDDFPAEWEEYGRSGGRRLRARDPVDPPLPDLGERFLRTPFLDLATLELAAELARREQLGAGSAPDLLAIGLSATDTVGHLYGPESLEARDALRRLDAALGDFLAELEARLGPGALLVALSSDHGVLPLPEWLAATGRSQCPVEGGRVGLRWFGAKLLWRLHRSFGGLFSWPAAWLQFTGYQATVDRELAAERDVAVEDVVAVAEAHLEAEPAVAEVWTREEILHSEGPRARLYRNSFDPERSGDLVLEPVATCLIYPFDEGTSHGTVHAYDREVPVAFWGAGVAAGVVPGEARTVDVAPTLARALGLELPAALDGRPLPLR